MNSAELSKDIKWLSKWNIISGFSLLMTIILFGLFCLFVLSKHFFAAIIILVFMISFIALLVKSNKSKVDFKHNGPYILDLNNTATFENVLNAFQNYCSEKDFLKIDDNMAFYNISKKFKYRICVMGINEFDKTEYDSLRHRGNKKYNKHYGYKEKVSLSASHRMMRINIIVTNVVNRDLYEYISIGAGHNLSRVEGMINFVICGNKLYVPPINGDTDITCYKNSISFVKYIF